MGHRPGQALKVATRSVNHLVSLRKISRRARFVAFGTLTIGCRLMNDDELKAWTRAEIKRCQALGRPSRLQQQLMEQNTNPCSLARAKAFRQELLDAEASGSTPECVRSLLNATTSRSLRSPGARRSVPGQRKPYAPTPRERPADRSRQGGEESPTGANVRETRSSGRWWQPVLNLFGGSSTREKP
jgi:hypothetical protein